MRATVGQTRGQEGTGAAVVPKGWVQKGENEPGAQSCLAHCSAPCAHKQGERAEGQGRNTGRATLRPKGEGQRVGYQGAPHIAMHRARSSRKGRDTKDSPKRAERVHEGRGARGTRGGGERRAGARADTGEAGG